MCFVLTPYYHLCGHYGHPVVAPHGRCARAEQTSGTCSETHDIGIKTVEAKCVDCERMVNSTIIRHPLTARVGPVDCQKFNQLVKLHKQTFDRRRASIASIPSSVTSTAFLQTADEVALRRSSTASEVSAISTSTGTIPTEGRLPVLTVNSSRPTLDQLRRAVSLPVTRIPAWTSVEDWTKQVDEHKNHGAQTM